VNVGGGSSGISLATQRRKSQKPHGHHHHHQIFTNPEEEFDFEATHHTPHELFDRNITQLCSSLDLSTVYNPPSSLLLPGDSGGQEGAAVALVGGRQRQTSVSGSGSGSDSESSASSGGEELSRSRRESKGSRKSSGTAPNSQQQTHEIDQHHHHGHHHVQSPPEEAAPTPSHPPGKEGPMRQGSFGSGSLLGHIASHAKELVKETKRQSSQEGLLSQVDKVNSKLVLDGDWMVFSLKPFHYYSYDDIQLKTKTKEKLTEVRQGSVGSASGDETGFMSPLEHVRIIIRYFSRDYYYYVDVYYLG
jgi:hypothetical protein